MKSTETKVESGLRRLLQIKFVRTEYDHELAGKLAGEYIRRVAEMSEKENVMLSSPFFDPLSILSVKGWGAKEAVEILQMKMGSEVKNAYVRRTFECYLQWCDGIDYGDPLAIACPDLFEPLIRLIEIGGEFGLHHGELMVGTSAIPLRDWKRFINAEPLRLRSR